MCSATLGAAPVNRWTWAASAIFSYGSRGTPCWANTLNLVPELPNAHEGSSTFRSRMPVATACSVVISVLLAWSRSCEVKNLLECAHLLVGRRRSGHEVRRHQLLPPRVDRLGLHRRHGVVECARRLEVPEQRAVVVEEQRVVVPAAAL